MKNKILLLIISSVAALVALSSIQGYLIKNTYRLKKDAFIEETKESIITYAESLNSDTLYTYWAEDLKGFVTDYLSDRITKESVVQKFKAKAFELNDQYDKRFNTELKKLDLGYDVDFQRNITSIVILDQSGNDTIYSNNGINRFTLFGNEFSQENSYSVNKSQAVSEHSYFIRDGEKLLSSSFNLEIRSENRMQVSDWRRIVFGRLAALFIGSILLFLFVIGLMYYSINNLITQKKISEIKTDFINNITHELKTPLATLSIATKTLKNKEVTANPDVFSNTLNIVERQNNRLQKLIDQVMSNSLSSDEIVLSKEQVLDNEYFGNLLHDFRLSSQRNDLTIINEVCKENVYMRIDKFHFSTAILNILENAVKYGTEDTQILIKTQLRNGDYIIEIADNGIGIPDKKLASIFEKFYRVSDGDVHNVKGLGLGLYYTSQIVHAHHGTIDVDSEVNKGTRFTIKIPIN